MHLGVVLPRTAIGADPAVLTEYVSEVEAAGYDHVIAYDHVLGENPATNERGYDRSNPIHEPLVLYGYLAAHTTELALVTGILILPQRRTALVAKQAAEVDVLSGGRLRLGVGVGWNAVEYEALGADFHTRGRRIEEQVDVLRRLWTEDLVTYDGEHHTITDAGLNPRPPQQPIPVWMGGNAAPVLERAGRIADGWLPYERDPAEAAGSLERLRGHARDAGRDPDDLAIAARVKLTSGDRDAWLADLEAWRDLGATHVAADTMGAGHDTLEAHRDAMLSFVELAANAGVDPAG